MRLCTDRRLLAGAATGVASYAEALARAQATLSAESMLLVEARPAGDEPGARWRRIGAAAWPGSRRVTMDAIDSRRLVGDDLFRIAQVHFDIWKRPLAIRAPGRPGMIHWSYPVPMLLAGWRNVYTVHDAIPLVRPDLTPIDPRRHRRLLVALAGQAARFVTVSQAARAEIVSAIGCDADFVVDCGQSVEPLRGAAPLPGGLEPGGYLLVCGTVERRKNVARLVRAYRRAGAGIPLVVAGPEGWGGADAEREIAETVGAIRLPYLPATTIASLIGQARALLMPSLAEGFGLPIVEAMALGTAVLTARGGATEEAAGGAALLVDPESDQELTAGIARIATEVDYRDRLISAGTARARDFAPMRFAARLAQAYADIASAPRPSYPPAGDRRGGTA